jgi:hypothetical protein
MNPDRKNLDEKDVNPYLNEVSHIEIRTFPIEGMGAFNNLNLDQKLEKLEEMHIRGEEEFSKIYPAIGLGDAFQKAVNAMYSGESNAAMIVERRVVTLLKK